MRRKRIAVCSVVAFLAVFGTAACAGGGNEQQIEALEERVELLEEEVAETQLLLGTELEEEPQQEQTQQEPAQQEKTQERTQQEKTQ